MLEQYIPNSGNLPKTEQRALTLDYNEAIYTIRILALDGKLLEWKQWKFVPGNPNPVAYWQGKGP